MFEFKGSPDRGGLYALCGKTAVLLDWLNRQVCFYFCSWHLLARRMRKSVEELRRHIDREFHFLVNLIARIRGIFRSKHGLDVEIILVAGPAQAAASSGRPVRLTTTPARSWLAPGGERSALYRRYGDHQDDLSTSWRGPISAKSESRRQEGSRIKGREPEPRAYPIDDQAERESIPTRSLTFKPVSTSNSYSALTARVRGRGDAVDPVQCAHETKRFQPTRVHEQRRSVSEYRVASAQGKARQEPSAGKTHGPCFPR